MHLNTIQENKPRKQLEVSALDTMKNIPSPESFNTSLINPKLDKLKNKEMNYLKNDLETIKDDQSSKFESDRFDDSNPSKDKSRRGLASSVSSSSEESKGKNVFHKQDTMGFNKLE